ncbi:unnamed protein product [Phaedon cochleariae]|uniref:Mediator of DNA damage checkpoint protein 1 n=1 Tax=Phaedon cochleariae TaxID=80249 RepID=A0A9P0GPF2_PHACE|nr:unnamed protein product [Phaedon cochleariae]
MEQTNSVKVDQFKRIQAASLLLGEKQYPVFKGINTIGRNKIAIINIKHLNVSQNQAIIVIVDENQHFISDLNSSNGTFIHNAKLFPFKLYELTNGTDIKFGDVEAKYSKVANNNTTVNLQETLEMTQNMTQNFYASNTQLVINASTLNQSDEHNYSNISLQKSQQLNVIEDIHDMATQVEEYPKQCTAKSIFNKPFAKPSISRLIEKNMNDIHDAPTQVVTYSDSSSDKPEIAKQKVLENIEEDIEATQVMNYPDKCNVPIWSHKDKEVNQQNIVNHNIEEDIEATQIMTYPDKCNVSTLPARDKEVNQQKIVIHNSQIPSTSGSGLNTINNFEPEESLVNSRKSIGTQGIIDETLIQPDNENSNDSVDFFTIQKIDDEENINSNRDVNLKDASKIIKDSVSVVPNNSDNPEPVKSLQKSITEGNSLGSNMHSSRKVTSSDSGSETDIEDSEEDIPKRKKPKLRKLDSEDSSTPDICTKKKPLKKLDSDGDTDNSDNTQDICLIKKPLKRLESDDSNSDSNNSISKNQKFENKKVIPKDVPLTKIDKDYISESETDCEEEIGEKKVDASSSGKDKLKTDEKKCDDDSDTEIEDNDEPVKSVAEKIMEKTGKKKVDASNSDKNKLKTDQGKCNDDSDTDIEDNDVPVKTVAEKIMDDLEHSMQQKDSSKLEESTLNDTDCIPATQDAFAEEFSYKSSKLQINDNQSSEEESFKLGITQLMEDGTENKTEEYIDKNKPNNEISISTDNENNQQMDDESEVAKNDSIFFEPTQKIIGAKEEVPMPVKFAEDADSSKNDEVYFMPTQQINSEQDTQPDFKVPTKKYTFKKKPVNLEESLTTILSNKIEDDIYMVATQQIDVTVSQKEKYGSIFKQATQKLDVENDEDDVFIQATQCINVEATQETTRKHPEVSKDDDVYFLPTQQISVLPNDAQADGDGKKDQNDMYMLDTQILPEIPCGVSEDKKESLEKTSNEQNNIAQADPPVILNDMSMLSHDTQSELSFVDENMRSCSDNARPENPLAHVLNKESKTGEIEDFQSGTSKSEIDVSSPSRRKLTKKSDIKNLQEKIKADIERDDAETLSQIEAFIKKPLEIVPEEAETIAEKDDVETLSQIEAFIKKPLDVNNSKVRRSVRKDQTLTDQETIRTDDVNQSFALLETKTSKVRRPPKKDTNVDEIKVTVTAHRRSMSVAETSMKEALDESRLTRKSGRVTNNNNVSSNSSRGKRKLQTNELESSKPVPAKVTRRNSVKNEPITESASKKNSRSMKKIGSDNCIGTIHEEPSTSSDEPSTPSRKRTGSRLKAESDVTSTPKRNNRPTDESLLNSAERSKRKQRPKVVFTMLDNPQLELYIKHLGGSVVDDVDAATVLVTGEVKRSQKLLAAVAQGKPICSPRWIQASKKSNEFLDPWDFILTDKEAESKWDFSLEESLNRAKCKKLLTNYTFQLMVSKAADVLKGAIEASGGKCSTRNPGKNVEGHFVVVASPENKAKYSKLKKQNPNLTIVEPEAIFDGVLRQELRFTRHLVT